MTLTVVSRGRPFPGFRRRLGPDEGLGLGVVLIQVVHNGALLFDDAFRQAASYALVDDQAKETLDLVEPGRRRRREVHVEARMLGQPRFHRRMLVGGEANSMHHSGYQRGYVPALP